MISNVEPPALAVVVTTKCTYSISFGSSWLDTFKITSEVLAVISDNTSTSRLLTFLSNTINSL